MDSSYNSSSTKPLFRGTQVVWYLLSVLEVILAFRVLLKLTAANSYAGFTSFIYAISSAFVAPFALVFPKTTVEGSTLEWSTLLAMIVYWVIAVGIIRLFLMSRTVSTPEAAVKLQEKDPS
ncbi:MAG: YggT family protein [Patescibacteria group bacterium]